MSIREMTWECDPELEREARRMFARAMEKVLSFPKAKSNAHGGRDGEELALRALLVMPRFENPDISMEPKMQDAWETLLQSAGTLCYLGFEEEIAQYRPRVQALWPAVEKWRLEDPLEYLEQGFFELVQLEPQLRRAALLDPEEDTQGEQLELQEHVVEIFAMRDDLQLSMKGCEALWGRELPLCAQAAENLAVFDQKVWAMSYLLLPFNERRRRRLFWVKPSMQADFWWWERGIAYPRNILQSLADAAQLLYDFPEAEEFLESLRKNLSVVSDWMRASSPHAQVADSFEEVTLRERLQTAGGVGDGPIRLAASSVGGEGRMIHEDEDCGVYVASNQLHVFLKKEITPENNRFSFLPTAYIRLTGGGEILPSSETPGINAAFSLDDPGFSASGGVLMVQCGEYQRELPLDSILQEH